MAPGETPDDFGLLVQQWVRNNEELFHFSPMLYRHPRIEGSNKLCAALS